jgi:hypothetical protein
VHLPRSLAAEACENAIAHVALLRLNGAGRAPGGAAARTAGRLVLEPLAGVKLLFACRENEAISTIFAGDFFVNVSQCGATSFASTTSSFESLTTILRDPQDERTSKPRESYGLDTVWDKRQETLKQAQHLDVK